MTNLKTAGAFRKAFNEEKKFMPAAMLVGDAFIAGHTETASELLDILDKENQEDPVEEKTFIIELLKYVRDNNR